MANLKEYTSMLSESAQFRSSMSKSASRIVEGIPREFPVEPEETRWSREKGKFLKVKFEFSNRDKLKDFVSSVQELEDRSHHFCRMIVEKSFVTLKCEIEGDRVSDTSERFLLKAKQIYESISND